MLSHAHRDHYADLGAYLDYARALDHSIAVIASSATFVALDGVADMSGADLTNVDDEGQYSLGPFALEFSRTTHQIPTLGVRLSVSNRHVVYSADTGPNWRVPASWRRPDLAILECTYEHRDEAAWPYHLASEDVAVLAQEIEAVSTLITHVPPREHATQHLRAVEIAAPRLSFALAELGQRIVFSVDDVYE